jgi:hypothetical protein
MRKIAALSLAGFFAIATSPTHAQTPCDFNNAGTCSFDNAGNFNIASTFC